MSTPRAEDKGEKEREEDREKISKGYYPDDGILISTQATN
jgi:hypothetical protein